MEQEFRDLIRIDPETHDLVADAAEMIAAVAQQKKDIEKADKAIKDKLMGVMGAAGVMKFENDRLAVSVVTPAAKTRQEFDLEALKQDFPEIAEAYTKTVEVPAAAPYIKITVR